MRPLTAFSLLISNSRNKPIGSDEKNLGHAQKWIANKNIRQAFLDNKVSCKISSLEFFKYYLAFGMSESWNVP